MKRERLDKLLTQAQSRLANGMVRLMKRYRRYGKEAPKVLLETVLSGKKFSNKHPRGSELVSMPGSARVNADLPDGDESEYSEESNYVHADQYARDFFEEEDADTYTWDSATGERKPKKHVESFVEMLSDAEFFTVTQALGLVQLDKTDDTDRLAAIENARNAIEKWFTSRPEHNHNLKSCLEKTHLPSKLGEVSQSLDEAEKKSKMKKQTEKILASIAASIAERFAKFPGIKKKVIDEIKTGGLGSNLKVLTEGASSVP